MASVFRRKEWVNRHTGKRCGKSHPDATRRISTDWYGSFMGADGLWHKENLGSDKTEALRLASHFENQARLRRAGLIDPKADGYADAERIALPQHIDTYERSLKTDRVSDAYATMTGQRVRKVIAAAKLEWISDLKPGPISETVAAMKSEGVALRTRSHYLRAVKQFCRWLVKERLARDDALFGLKVRVAISHAERQYVRRALNRLEYELLVERTETSDPAFKMSGEDRAWFYRLASITGFRSAEVRSLTPESFDLDGDEPVVKVLAGYSKRGKRSGRDDVQPIPVTAVELLGRFLAGKPVKTPLFAVGKWDVADMLRADLRRARARWIRDGSTGKDRRERRKSEFLATPTASGEVVDYHSFRHSFITWLSMSGAPVKVVQTLARHSTPVLTMNTYTHPKMADSRLALESVPVVRALNDDEKDVANARIAGTEGMKIRDRGGKPRGKTSVSSKVFLASRGELPEVRRGAESSVNTEENYQFSRGKETADGGSRTRNLRFTKPLLCH